MSNGKKVSQYITKTQNDHPAILASRLGDMDRMEIEVYGFTPQAGLELSYKFAEKCWIGIYDDQVILMVGVGSMAKIHPYLAREKTAGIGVPWLLGTGEYKGCRRTFMELSKVLKKEMHKMFPVLRNFVAIENKAAVTWLKWLGFKMVQKHHNFNGSGRDFYMFESIRE